MAERLYSELSGSQSHQVISDPLVHSAEPGTLVKFTRRLPSKQNLSELIGFGPATPQLRSTRLEVGTVKNTTSFKDHIAGLNSIIIDLYLQLYTVEMYFSKLKYISELLYSIIILHFT